MPSTAESDYIFASDSYDRQTENVRREANDSNKTKA